MPKGKGGKGASSKRSWEDEMSSRPSSKASATISLPCATVVAPPEATSLAPPEYLKPSIVTMLEDGEGDSMIAATPVLSDAECQAWMDWGDKTGFVLEKHAQTSNIAHRDNWRLAVESPEIARSIFHRLQPWVPSEVAGKKACGCNPNIRLYKYENGQRFGPHVDQANRLADGSATEYTVLIYLNDAGLEGGETIFYGSHGSRPTDDTIRFAPKKGACLVHAHGMRCLTHEGSAVTAGVKYLLRTDISYR